MNQNLEIHNMPVLALRGLVLFPGMLLHFDVGRKKSLAALKDAMDHGQRVFLAAQKDLRTEDPESTDLYPVGTVASVRQMVKLPGSDNMRVVVEGEYRAFLSDLLQTSPYLFAMVQECTEKRATGLLKKQQEGYLRNAKSLFEQYAALTPKLSPDVIVSVLATEEPGTLADYIASNISVDFKVKQGILSAMNPVKRLELVCLALEQENQALAVEREVQEKLQEQVDKSQREYYLREEMKVISDELGDSQSPQEEKDGYDQKIRALGLDAGAEEKLLSESAKLGRMPYGSQEATVVRNYLDTCLDLPWNRVTKDTIQLEKAKKLLDKEHFGLEKVKERILELLATRKLAPDITGQILCLVGPPGVGKTSIARSLAQAMGRKYVRLALGGVKDEAEIRGHRRTYIGAMPGRIISAVKQAGVKNPLILLDEVDKLGADYKGDPSSALLEALDPEQNNTFRDHYIELPFDLSQVLFITTANDASAIPGPLLDRMEMIELSSYTHEEKFQIAKRHLLKKQMARHGLTAAQFRMKDEALHSLIDSYTGEAGVRELERQIATLCRKAARKIVGGASKRMVVTAAGLKELLGPEKYKAQKILPRNEVGVATGLAWTSVGGTTLPVEVSAMEGTGKIEITGNLGDVMQESAKAAVTFVRVNAGRLRIDPEFYKKKDLHIHAPEGAVPKDGPSAGITMATAIISELTGTPIYRDVAMTGEISLKGNVMPIGGLKEKSMAAYRLGVRKVIIPRENVPDLAEADPAVLEQVEFFPVSTLFEVLEIALAPREEEPPVKQPAMACPVKNGECPRPLA